MTGIRKPKITTGCVADRYAGSNERIIEFSHEHGGGLISIVATDDGRLLVSVYRQDSTVDVKVGAP